ncbi:MAG: response regulator transcription factor [Bacteroidia bacterium]|nr:response regulator transcription factor [Bacteroidia bacterium]
MKNLKIKSIIVDDEDHNREVLKKLINMYCPELIVISEANSTETAFAIINDLKPELIFLDVKMPDKNGLELLKMFDKLTFEVIFVTAYNEFAINAFDFNAIGYVLKPVDHNKLINSVNRAISIINSNHVNDKLEYFFDCYDDDFKVIKKIKIFNNNNAVLLNVNEIVSIVGEDDGVLIKMNDNRSYYTSKNILDFEKILAKISYFIRINRSVIVNINYVVKYSKGENCEIFLSNLQSFSVSKRKKTEIISKITL